MSTNPDTGATVAVVDPIPILTEALSGHPVFTGLLSFFLLYSILGIIQS